MKTCEDAAAFPASRWRDGDRDTYEQAVFARQHRLSRAVVMAAATLEDAWLDEVADGVTLLCEQSTWCWPAHDDTFVAHGSVVPTVTDPFVDLGAGEVVGQLAWLDHVLGAPLDARYLKCLPESGLKVLDHIRFNPDTTDFTPIFNKIEGEHPDVIITGISHVGVQPTVQWHDQRVPIAMAGQSSQATTSTFWKDTNGAAEGVITATAAGPGVAITPKTIPFIEAYQKKYGATPAYSGFAAYDDVYIIANAAVAAGSTDPDKLVAAMEKTDYVGTIGRVQFYGKDSQYTHAMKYGKDYVSGTFIQWQNGKQVTVWPTDKANAKIKFPDFVKLPEQHAAK